MHRFCQLLILLITAPFLCGFVFLSPHGATLDVTTEAPEVMFIWSGDTPVIDKKEEYAGGAYQDLNDHDFFAQLLQDAMDIWNNVPGSYVVMTLAEGDAKADTEDGQHSIVIDAVNLSSAAFALPIPDKDNAKTIFDCDITISAKKAEARPMAFTIAHELGHCLGLGHSHSNYAAMMGYSRTSYSLKLGADDAAGIIYLYPDPYHAADEPKELVTCATVVGTENAISNLLVLCFLLLPALWAVTSRALVKA